MIPQDVRYALRSLIRAPGFTLVTLITLALGIGGTTAIFSVVDGILLRSLPYPEPSAIVRILRSSATDSEGSGFSAADYLDYRNANRGFTTVAGYRTDVVDLSGSGEPVRLMASETTSAFFDVFGVPALHGRVYTKQSDVPQGPRVVVVSEGMWKQHLGSDPNIVGRTLRLNGIPMTVVGVMPGMFAHPPNPDLWVLAPNEVPTSPVAIEDDPLANREVHYFEAIARLRPSVTLAQANDDLRTISERLSREHSTTNDGETTRAVPLQETLVGGVRTALLVLLGAVGFVLLIACANVAGLLLARGAGRRREFAVRTALGAARGRLIRQLLTESLVLAGAGGLLGLVVAYWGVKALVALVALVLLIGAGLMLTSFARLRAVDPGFRVSSLIVVGVPLPQARYDNPAQARFYTQLFERLREDPTTARSALGFPTPFGGANAAGGYTTEGAQTRSRADRTVAQLGAVTPGYFQTLGIPLLHGRDFELTDTRDRPSVVIVNQTLAEREWPGQNPIGKRVAIGGEPDGPQSWILVVGVVANSKRDDLQAGPQPVMYLPHTQFTLPFMGVVVRTEAGETAVANAVRAAVRTLDPELPIEDVETLDRILERVTGQPRFRALLIASFACAALLLAAVGLYGLISYTVTQRAPEIGVRLALGATPSQVGRQVVGQGMALAALGVVCGWIAAAAATRLLDGLLFSVSATDPTVYSVLAALLLAIAVLATYIPARRAMRVDPMTALRSE